MLTRADLIVGHTYAARKRSVICTSFFRPLLFNDRQILWMDETFVQYDSPAVRDGRHYPKMTIEKFLLWAGEDVTEKMPKDEWRHVPPPPV